MSGFGREGLLRPARNLRPEYFYAHPAVEMAGVELDFFEIDGVDLSWNMHGYSDIFATPLVKDIWEVPEPDVPLEAPDRAADLIVPRLEPHDDPAWLEPSDRFQEEE